MNGRRKEKKGENQKQGYGNYTGNVCFVRRFERPVRTRSSWKSSMYVFAKTQ